MLKHIIWFDQLTMANLNQVGGKNASLGEMISKLSASGIDVPAGFATTVDFFTHFLRVGGVEERIAQTLAALDEEDVDQLAHAGARIRGWIMDTPFPAFLADEIAAAYQTLLRCEGREVSVAVRSSATAEDLPDASFAGQQETCLNVNGLDNVLAAIKKVFASLYNDRAISYRKHRGFAHNEVAISAGVQTMVRSDIGASGVMFTVDTESGFQDVVLITSTYGLGETLVQGAVNPDEFYVYKPNLENKKRAILARNIGSKLHQMIYSDDPHAPTRIVEVEEAARLRFSLSDEEVQALAMLALKIERHYGRPMDIEWAKDGTSGKLYILQARPETVTARNQARSIERYRLIEHAKVLCSGRSIGQRIGAGPAKVIRLVTQMNQVQTGDVLVTDMTDPDWEPVMKRAAAIVTNRGGRTCHAAIIARELGIPAVVGTADATENLRDGMPVTVSCAEGDTGYIYQGLLDYKIDRIELDAMPELPLKVMINVGNPERAFSFAALPNAGVGLARLEFIINQAIGIHPKAVLNHAQMPAEIKRAIDKRAAAYADPVDFYVEKLTEGVGVLAAAFAPKPVIVRLSDFKSNEYSNLLGGSLFEPKEENPMLGYRGARRYLSGDFEDCFALECRAIKQVREALGLDNVEVMVPFVRTVDEARQVVELLAENGLKRGENGLRVIMMCEVPSNALLAEEFLRYFDGFSIGSNDLTQLTLGVDRDSGLVAEVFDERNPAVIALLPSAISACKGAGKYVGICGQGPSDYPDFSRWLLAQHIDSVSLNPDTVIETWIDLAQQKE